MAASVPFRLCRNILRNVAATGFRQFERRRLISSIPNYATRICLDRSCRCVQAINACGFHKSVINSKGKSGRKKPVKEEEESEEEVETEEEEEEEVDEMATDYRLQDCPVNSLRVDSVAKVGLGIQRAAVEQMMLDGKIRVNGEFCRKKGTIVEQGTMIDQILDSTADNLDLSNVKRLIVHKIHDKTDKQGRAIVTVKKWNSLTVDDYKLTRGD